MSMFTTYMSEHFVAAGTLINMKPECQAKENLVKNIYPEL